MCNKSLSKTAYLDRLGCSEPTQTTFHYLKKLVLAHLLSIPFENLDIHDKIPITLNIDNIYNKIVARKRGGFCYELNGLFFHLLKSVGYDVRMISARVYGEDGSLSPEYDHLALLVTINDTSYLTDVGFGEFAIIPLTINTEREQYDGRKYYRVIKELNGRYLVMHKDKNKWVYDYNFNLKPRSLDEFNQMCEFHQTNSESHFMKKRVCTILTKDGRITMADAELKIDWRGEKFNTSFDSRLINKIQKYYFFN
ncbi:arylamine N-acetyltransferase family protein [Fulvivirga lutea]|uniref:Arylamine N-acetyltransferase n=1 Tax=Fulvivirga lutea TaxID=2810512 RepID=A0A974WHU9_9BACT|nr:arylamine N-acetyltransferase [Fulvivirga lutea]QSE98671.1 arylamine N-acetyltransferase [Fulvivirga lutea]